MLENEELQAIQEMDFETAFEALQENVKELEGEGLSLEESLKRYQRGQALARHCAELLERAELQVRTLAMDATQPIETEE
ncbi:MAG TPA: exodeoxyribonuclease VII small subunit [Anaerolineaceae bacterium]|jgi:exodeoxyribonuclease VII small subunit|nr:MAG: Exodeoxyribonuclease 7 small subunit [Anaerolineaceae bacterium 46_22]HAF47809.1 exodeoxyribonuclease VII small subunit [Anaerolineaceae bacterium]